MADQKDKPGPPPSNQSAAATAPQSAAASSPESTPKSSPSAGQSTRPGESQPVKLPDFAASNGSADDPAALGLLDDVTLRVKIELGRTQMYVEDVLRLNTNSVVELDKAAGDPVDIYVNDRHVARGEVLVLNENFCVRVSEIIQQVGTED